jgi:hypothetical protein
MSLCVLYESHNKQRLFPYTALTGFFITETDSVYYAVRTEYVSAIQFNLRLYML